MKRTVLAAAAVALSLGLVGRAQAQTRLTSTGTNYGSFSTVKTVVIDQERLVLQMELMGIRLDDTGAGPFHKIATHILMLTYIDKGVVSYHGIETHTDKDGDKVIWEMSGEVTTEDRGRGKVIAATGKFAGMEGTMDFVTTQIKAFPEGTGRTFCKETMNLVLKKPLQPAPKT